MIKILKIDKIIFNKELYPRVFWDKNIIEDYAYAIKKGVKFPPITVASRKDKYILVDGIHRIEAFKRNNIEYIEAEILKGLSDKEIYIESIKRNAIHGIQLSNQDKIKIVKKLDEIKCPVTEISNILNLSIEKIIQFKAYEIRNVMMSERKKDEKEVIKNIRKGIPEEKLIKNDLINSIFKCSKKCELFIEEMNKYSLKEYRIEINKNLDNLKMLIGMIEEKLGK